jgi:hypothetical protein
VRTTKKHILHFLIIRLFQTSPIRYNIAVLKRHVMTSFYGQDRKSRYYVDRDHESVKILVLYGHRVAAESEHENH